MVDVSDHGRVRVVALNRPAKRNALSSDMLAALIAALDAAAEATGVRAIVLTGRGAAFCAGADLQELQANAGDREAATQRADLTHALLSRIRAMGKLVVAAVHGAAFGVGAALAMSCDLIVAARDLRLGFPELGRGVMPALALAALQRRIGEKLAFELIFAGRVLLAEEMRALGLVNQIANDAQGVEAAAVALAERCGEANPMAVARAKALFYHVAALPFEQAMAAGHALNIAANSEASEPAP